MDVNFVHKPSLRSSKFFSKKILLSVAALGTAGAIAGLGTFAAFTSTTSASNTATSGKVVIAVGASGPANRFSVSSGTLVPGDTVQRAIDLISTSTTGDLGAVTLTTTATTSSLLDTDGTNGLQMVLDNCSVAWTESTAPYTYTCSGTASSVLATRAVIGTSLALSNLSIVLGAPGTDHLRLTLTLPSGAGTDNTFQNKTSTILYTFDATQRTSTNR
jgi:predicted ribosomally synthesized peptide with SipW-like signal peptide